MNTFAAQPLARLSSARRYAAYAEVPADRDAERLLADLAALPVTASSAPTGEGALRHLRSRLGAAFHRSVAA